MLPFVALSFLVLTALIFAQQVGRQADAVFNSAASVILSLQLMACLLPGIVIITLPFSLLIGTLMALNRLSADGEVVAAKACGISLRGLALPLLLCGAAGTAASAWMTLDIMPRAVTYGKILSNQILLQALTAPVKPRSFDTHFPDTLVYVRDVDKESGDWVGVFLVRQMPEEQLLVLTASRGKLRLSRQTPVTLEVQLLNGMAMQISDPQLSPMQRQTVASFERQDIRLSENESALASGAERARAIQELSLGQLARRAEQSAIQIERRQAAVEWHKRLSLPVACLLLTLVAVPLGAGAARQAGRAVAFALGFGLAVAYYLTLLAGQNLAISGALPAWAGAWLPNLAAVLGLVSLLADHPYGAGAVRARSLSRLGERVRRLGRPHATGRAGGSRSDLSSSLTRPGLGIGRLIDRLLLSEGVKYFVLALGVLVLTSLTFTLFDLLPALLRSGLGWRYGATYLLYLSPQIAYFTAPFALLLALLAAHGVLARSNQLTALLASGQSVVRLSWPLVVMTTILMAALFWASVAVLPTTNREQDERYSRIKGRRSEQAVVFANRKWVNASDGKMYSYAYLSTSNILLNTTAYKISPQNFWLSEMVHAREAVPTSPTAWAVLNGWRYDVSDPFAARFHELGTQSPPFELSIPDGAGIFTRTVNEATKMNFAELRDHLRQLSRLGAPTAALRVELEKKRAFPFSCLTLIVTALPLLSIHSRRGALAGLGLSIVIGFAFWITGSLFEAAGKQSLLPAWLAAWGGQMLFLLLGVYLMLRRRTK